MNIPPSFDLDNYTLPGSAILTVSDNEYASAESIEAALVAMENLDFTDQNATLISYYGWDQETVLLVEMLYKKWLVLHKVYGAEIGLVPNKVLDEYWHFHILDTKNYMDDCAKVLGYYLHHHPYFGLTETETAADMARGFELTRELFQHHFGHDLTGDSNRCSSTSCR